MIVNYHHKFFSIFLIWTNFQVRQLACTAGTCSDFPQSHHNLSSETIHVPPAMERRRQQWLLFLVVVVVVAVIAVVSTLLLTSLSLDVLLGIGMEHLCHRCGIPPFSAAAAVIRDVVEGGKDTSIITRQRRRTRMAAMESWASQMDVEGGIVGLRGGWQIWGRIATLSRQRAAAAATSMATSTAATQEWWIATRAKVHRGLHQEGPIETPLTNILPWCFGHLQFIFVRQRCVALTNCLSGHKLELGETFLDNHDANGTSSWMHCHCSSASHLDPIGWWWQRRLWRLLQWWQKKFQPKMPSSPNRWHLWRPPQLWTLVPFLTPFEMTPSPHRTSWLLTPIASCWPWGCDWSWVTGGTTAWHPWWGPRSGRSDGGWSGKRKTMAEMTTMPVQTTQTRLTTRMRNLWLWPRPPNDTQLWWSSSWGELTLLLPSNQSGTFDFLGLSLDSLLDFRWVWQCNNQQFC